LITVTFDFVTDSGNVDLKQGKNRSGETVFIPPKARMFHKRFFLWVPMRVKDGG